MRRFLDWLLPGRTSTRIDAAIRAPVARVLEAHLALYARLPVAVRERLVDLSIRFLAEKEFIGRDGFVLTAEMQALIAAQACVLTLGWNDLRPLRRATAVAVHARAFGQTVEAIGADGRRYHFRDWAAGRAWQLGIVELAWDSVALALRYPRDGFNVVYHEFAHVLDGADGSMGGVPPLGSRAAEARWTAATTRAYERLCGEVDAGGPAVLSAYGATSAVEFFPVATESFFERPAALWRWDAELFEVFREYFQQDPREYEAR